MTKRLDFNKNGYTIIKNALSAELLDFVTQYALFDEMQDYSKDSSPIIEGSPHSKYADPVMETILINLQDKIEEATGLELYPTYSYYRVYRPGNDLKPHRDRESCEISATLCFNFNYEDYNWPIYMDGNKVNQQSGDLVIYKGIELEHYRDMFDLEQEDAWHVQGFFHYVDRHGPYKNFKFDQRENIGMPLTSKNEYKSHPTFSWLQHK